MTKQTKYEIIVEDIPANIKKFHEVPASLFYGHTVAFGTPMRNVDTNEITFDVEYRTVKEFVITQFLQATITNRVIVAGDSLSSRLDVGDDEYHRNDYELWAIEPIGDAGKNITFNAAYITDLTSRKDRGVMLILEDGLYKVCSSDRATGEIDIDWPIVTMQYADKEQH